VSAETSQKDEVAPPKKAKKSTPSSPSTNNTISNANTSGGANNTPSSSKLRWNWDKRKKKKRKKKKPKTNTPPSVKTPVASSANATTNVSTTPASSTKASKTVKAPAAALADSSTTWNWSKKKDYSITGTTSENFLVRKAHKTTAEKPSLTKHTTPPRQTKTALKASLSLSPAQNMPPIPGQPKRARKTSLSPEHSSIETDVTLNAKKKDVAVSTKKESLETKKKKTPSRTKKPSTHDTVNTQATKRPADSKETSLSPENASVETGLTVKAGDKSPVTKKKKTPSRTKKASTHATKRSADSEDASLSPENACVETDLTVKAGDKSPVTKKKKTPSRTKKASTHATKRPAGSEETSLSPENASVETGVTVNAGDKSLVTKKRKTPSRTKKVSTHATVNSQASKPSSDSEETKDEDWAPDLELTKKTATTSRTKKPANKTSSSNSNVAIVDSSLAIDDTTTIEKKLCSKKDWRGMMSRLVEFHQEHGHFDIRRVKHSDDTLAKWVAEQQYQYIRYKAGTKVSLREERVHLLNEIGFDWEGPPIDWDELFKALADYKADYGHLRISQFKVYPKHETLHQIAYRIRQEYKFMKGEGTSQILTRERIDQLNELEFLWGWAGHSYQDDNWDAKYLEMKGYIEKYGEFPRSCHNYPNSGSLYRWISDQRKEYRVTLKQKKDDSNSTEVQVKLQDDQIIKLKALGAGFAKPIQVRARDGKRPTTQAEREIDDKKFQTYIRHLEEYQKEHGNCFVPPMYAKDQGLANWCTKQRRMYKLAGKESPSWPLTTERIRILNGMGFSWDVVPNQEVEQDDGDDDKDDDEHDKWDSFFSMLREFKAKKGHTHVSKQNSPDLSRWCSAQRKERHKFEKDPSTSILTQERMRSLEEIEFSWKTINYKDHHWRERFNQLKEFKSKHGHCVVFRSYTHDGLAVWVRHQRRQYIKHQKGIRNELNPERIDALDSIDFASELNRPAEQKTIADQGCNPEQFWDDRFQELQDYFDKMGHSLVPAAYQANHLLGAWASDQRKQYTRLQNGFPSDLTPERIEKLEILDFAWSFAKGRKALERDWGVGREIIDSLIHSEPERDTSQTTTTRPVLYNSPTASTNESGYQMLSNQTWDIRYAELKRFYETTGHCLVTKCLTTNITMVNWVITQRKEHRNNLKGRASTLTAYRTGKLDEINFAWNPAVERMRRMKMGKAEEDAALIQSLVERGVSFKDGEIKITPRLRVAWEERFQQLVEYKSIHGHCNVPAFYSPNKHLGRWVLRCRQSYTLFLTHGRSGVTPGNNSINQERIGMLDSIGFMWDDAVAKKKRERGSDDKSPEKKKARRSGVMNVSRSIESPLPIPQNDDLLEQLTPLPLEERATFPAQNNDFDEPASHLLRQNDNLDEPSTYFPHNDDSDGEMDNNIDFDTDEPDDLFSEKDKYAEEYKSERKVQQEEKLQEIWNLHFEELKEFKQKTGHCLVPSSFASKKLATFVRVQRRNYGMLKSGESKRMTRERFDLLDSIGFVWDAKKEKKKRESLGLSKLDRTAVLQLEAELPKVDNTNTNWIPTAHQEEKWQARLDDLRLYKKVHGSCNVRSYYSELNNLGKWVGSVRIKVKKFREEKPSAMNMERIAALEEIGFVFETHHITAEWDNFEERYDELVEYKSKFGDCKVPVAYANESLAYWITVQRMRYKLRQKNKASLMTDEQEQMLNALDFTWAMRVRNSNAWKQNYTLLKEYKETLGNEPDVDPFPKNCTYNGNVDLKKWVTAQRSDCNRFKEGRKANISEEKMNLLVEIGFVKR